VPALAIFASDALSSVAYATEEILLILALAGTIYFGLSIPIATGICLLLGILTISYRQTIYAYPNGGGAYIVARDNLGELAGLVAAAALLTDYILTVAVSISSGVAQMSSAFPAIQPFRVIIAVGLIAIVTLVNLRGLKESSTAFAIPTYFFLAMAFLTLIVGTWRWVSGTLGTVTGVEMVQHTLQPLSLFLVLRAFSSGSTALTGVEAISNGISAFKEPRSRNAARTLAAMSAILITLFLGITLLANAVGAVPFEDETVISQIARAVLGDGLLYFLMLGATTIILIMAANTSYADFPRLAALAAGDGFLPRQLTFRGSRLVFSWGIVGLAIVASLLIIVFDASVSALIPLYAIGVFLSFTISQIGMVVRWHRISKIKPGEEIMGREVMSRHDPRWRTKQLVNAVGALATGIVAMVFAVTKFREGAWIIIFLLPALVWVFSRIHRHYQEVARGLSMAGVNMPVAARRMQTLVLVDNLHAATIRAINFANSLERPWTAVHVSIDERRTADLQRKWTARMSEHELVILPSPYRSLTEPLVEYVQQIRQQYPESYIHLLMGGLTMGSYWEQALHRNSALTINLAFRNMEGVAITNIAFQLHHEDPAAGQVGNDL
jgi:amino acid transporter